MEKLIELLPEDGGEITYSDWRESCITDEAARGQMRRIHDTRRQGLVDWRLADENGTLTVYVSRADIAQGGGE